MPVLDVVQDPDALTITLTARFAAPVERVWQLFEDPRMLERWWGPPGWPAAFVSHELVEGGVSHYVMTGPEGERLHGAWKVIAVHRPRSFEIEDDFADEDGVPTGAGPSRMRTVLDPAADGTHLTTTTVFADAEQLSQMLEMDMLDGLRAAAGQIDDVLARSLTG